MAVQAATITGVQLISGNPEGAGARKVYLLTLDFPAYTGASDTSIVNAVAATISAHVRNGKTNAMIAGVIPFCAFPGQDTAGQAVYLGTPTISSDTLPGNLVNAAQTELTATTAVTGVGILVAVTES